MLEQQLKNMPAAPNNRNSKLFTRFARKLTPAVMEVLDKSVQLANAVDKVARMPGISKLAKVMANKADQNLQKQAEKAQRGLGVEPDPS